ncbi:MAG: DUF4177 domain-containing protein [Paracoccaceae bacterium]
MPKHEYKVIPAPDKGLKARGIKTPDDRFANALQEVMNQMGAAGWEYLRAETLPSKERSGFTGTTTYYRNMLVFRRALAVQADASEPRLPGVGRQVQVKGDGPPIGVAPMVQESNAPRVKSPLGIEDDPVDRPAGQPGAVGMLRDNGVEELSDVAGMTEALKNRAAHKSDG